MSDLQFVYVARCGRFFKVGCSARPYQRVADLQTGNPLEIEFVCSSPGDRDDEGALHRLWAPFRVSGEWFVVDPDFDWLLRRPDLFEVVIAQALVMEDEIEAWRARQVVQPRAFRPRVPVPASERRERAEFPMRWPAQLVERMDRVAAMQGMSRNAWLENVAMGELGAV